MTMKKIFALLTLFAISTTCFAFGVLSGESQDGLKKICYYDTPQGTVAITIASYKICPISIK